MSDNDARDVLDDDRFGDLLGLLQDVNKGAPIAGSYAMVTLAEWVGEAATTIDNLRKKARARAAAADVALRFYESILAYAIREAHRLERGEAINADEWDRRAAMREIYRPRPATSSNGGDDPPAYEPGVFR